MQNLSSTDQFSQVLKNCFIGTNSVNVCNLGLMSGNIATAETRSLTVIYL